jgi:hypothetical protein
MSAMKKLFSALAAALTLAAGGADAALTALAPENYTAVFSIGVRQLLRNRELQRTAAKPGIAKFFDETERAGLWIARIRELEIFYWGDHWYGAMRVDDADRLRNDLERKAAAGTGIAAAERCGKRLFRLKRPAEKNPRRRNKELCLVFWGGDVVVLAKTAEVEAFLKSARVDSAEAERLAANDAEVWCSYRRRRDAKPDDDAASIIDMNLKQGFLELRFVGDARRDVGIAGTADLGDRKTAKSMGMTLPGVLAFFMGLVLADDPATADRIVRALHTEVNGGELLLSMDVPEELLQRFLLALGSFFGDKQQAAKVPTTKRGGVR